MMEAIERFSAENCDLPAFVATERKARERGTTTDPAEVLVPTKISGPIGALEWV
jgi:ribosomal protein S12 methylthiotransferase accessory factor YcaO